MASCVLVRFVTQLNSVLKMLTINVQVKLLYDLYV